MKYLIIRNPAINRAVTRIARMLKYLSIKDLIDSPNNQISPATRKNRADRLIIEANKNMIKLISNAPADIVNILYGIGVNPAVNIIQKFQESYNS